MKKTKRLIILASASPRRRELLEKIGLKFEVDPSNHHEEVLQDEDPRKLAARLSLEKARAIAGRYPDAVIIAADTFGVLDTRLIGKPHTAAEAKNTLNMLSGRCHIVITGLAVLDTLTQKYVSRVVETKVYFRRLTADEIDAYVNTGEPLDKAGAYAIQGLGAQLIEKIEGDYYNVIGLPLSTLVNELEKFGIKPGFWGHDGSTGSP